MGQCNGTSGTDPCASDSYHACGHSRTVRLPVLSLGFRRDAWDGRFRLGSRGPNSLLADIGGLTSLSGQYLQHIVAIIIPIMDARSSAYEEIGLLVSL